MSIKPSFVRLLPILHVKSLESFRETLQALGFEIESGSSAHAIMSLDTGIFIHLKSSTTTPAPVQLIIEMSGHAGLEAYRDSLTAQNITVSAVSMIGWGKRKFSVELEDGHVLTFTQEKRVYQG